MSIKLFPIVHYLNFIAFLLLALLPVVYIYFSTFIQSYFSHHELSGSNKSAFRIDSVGL